MAELVNDFVDFRAGWLARVRDAWFAAPHTPLAPQQVDVAWCNKMQSFVYRGLNFVLQQTPKFIVTDFATAEKDEATTIALTAWACTRTDRCIVDADVFVHSVTCSRKPGCKERAAMLRLAQRVNNDWTIVPILAYLLRLAMAASRQEMEKAPTDTPDAVAGRAFALEDDLLTAGSQMQCLRDNGGGHIGLVEIDMPQLPVLQFASHPGHEPHNRPSAGPVHLKMNTFDKMNALRVGTRLMDPVHGVVLTGKRRVNALDVELTLFLVWRWFRDRNFQHEFEAAVLEFVPLFMHMVAKKTGDSGADKGGDADDLEGVVRFIESTSGS